MTPGLDNLIFEYLLDFFGAGKYIFGVLFGIMAKLALMHRAKSLTKKDVISTVLVGLATAYGVYHSLDYIGRSEIAPPLSVICGRYSDDILKLAGRMFLKKIKKTVDDEIDL